MSRSATASLTLVSSLRAQGVRHCRHRMIYYTRSMTVGRFSTPT
jgi:hypothetical protein